MTPRPYRWWRRTGIAAAVACGLCCAVPLIALLGGAGVLSALGPVFGVLETVSLVLAVLSLGGAGALWLRRRRRRACRVTDLGKPDPARRAVRGEWR
jgi:hypothetical protein